MRLNQIKLSGFKSFLEPTTLKFDTALTGIVGPNGCGKSNVVDAIRWVIGESSAKQLRGESLSDVIFGGSAHRKPVGKAQVELLFDNDQHLLGGRFSEYKTISIKREMTRDGGSTYFLNNSACRRKDIMDVLLGTGLGPRSYAVIEQGMISHLIAASAEELRGYLEEAAMVSKYKEKRKEAENRMAHTKENMHRIYDLTTEIGEQIKKLHSQVEVAESYKEWKQALKEINANIEALGLQSTIKKQQDLKNKIQKKEATLEALLLTEKQGELEFEKLNRNYIDQSHLLSKEQEHYYGIKVELSRLDQSISDKNTQIKTFEGKLNTFAETQKTLNQQMAQNESQLNQVEAKLLEERPLLDEKINELEGAQKQALSAQSDWKAWENRWNAFQQTFESTEQSLNISKKQQYQLQKYLASLKLRIERLAEEESSLNQEQSDDELIKWQKELDSLQAENEVYQKDQEQLEKNLSAKKQTHSALVSEIEDATGQLQAFKAEKHSLDSLQKLALGEGEGVKHLLNWLRENQNISEVPRLAQMVQVKPKWEKALETVLKDFLDALYLEKSIPALSEALHLEDRLSLVENKSEYNGVKQQDKETSLLAQITSSNEMALTSLLSGIYIAETLAEALKKRNQLKPHESIVTQDGVWLGANWLKTSEIKDEQAGFLARQNRLSQLNTEIENLQKAIFEKTEEREAEAKQLSEVESKIAALKKNKAALHDKKVQIEANLSAKKTYLEKTKLRFEHIKKETLEAQKEIQEQEQALSSTEKTIKQLSEKYEQSLLDKTYLLEKKADLKQVYQSAQSMIEQKERALREIKSTLSDAENKKQFLETQILRIKEKIQTALEQKNWFESELNSAKEALPPLEESLKAYQAQSEKSQSRIDEIKAAHQKIEHQIDEIKNRQQDEKSAIESTRKTLERSRIDVEAAQIQIENHQKHILDLGFESENLLEKLIKEGISKTKCLSQQAILTERIEALGEINLAAGQEYEQLKERKIYLDNQLSDLTTALETLENAIQEIDQETCAQLKKTFETVNENFKLLFSQIFQGGQAYLELTESNWLSTGIIVKAQPKGKRNTTIHLLSGGEKALTAIALIFSLFQLNPAPFCVLDEVDAPLDDHNIARFSRLVKEMSEKLQFIFISHSKVTLTLAKQLVGVTMKEPGVSRIVSVNIEEAIEMAE